MPSYGPANHTDRWQPVDAGYGRLIKEFVKKLFHVWWPA